MVLRTVFQSAFVFLLLLLLLLHFLSAPLAGQPPLAFEAASVKRNTSGERSFVSPRFQGTTVTATNVPVEALISSAYGVPSRDLFDAPQWIFLDMTGGERFDLNARAADGSSVENQRAMLRTLLEQRFSLRVRRETRELPVYILMKRDERGTLGPNLRPAVKDCQPRTACEGRASAGSASYTGAQWPIVLRSIGSAFNERLVDRTGLSGVFDFELTYNARGLSSAPGDAGVDIFGAVQQQFGLKLERGRAPFEVLVIESVQRPTPD